MVVKISKKEYTLRFRKVNSDIFIADDKSIMLGNYSGAPDVRLQWDTADADAHFLSLVLSGSNNFIISADNNIDWTHAAGTNPTLFIQSADQATVADYVSISHDQTNGIIATGSPDEIKNMKDPVVRQFITGASKGPITDNG